MFDSNKQYKQIFVDSDNYNSLKDLGRTGDSFNSVISKLIKDFRGDKRNV